MAAYLFGQVIGLAAKIIIASKFEAQTALDAFYAANRPSETLVMILAGGILVSSFVPVFVNLLVQEERSAAWRLASATFNIILLLTGTLALLAGIFAEPLVRGILGRDFSPEKQTLTVELLRIQLPSVVFFSLSAILVGTLNSHRQFLIPALTPAMYQIGQIFGAVVLGPALGIHGLAWGVVIGSALAVAIQIPSLLHLRAAYMPILDYRNRHVREVFRLMAPRMVGAAAVQAMLWVNTLLASRYDGAVYALTLGFMMMYMAQAAIAQSAATAALPVFSAQYALGKLDELRQTLVSVLRAEVLLSLPATAGLILLGKPIVRFLYERGEFTPHTTTMVAWALAWYAAGLLFHSVLEVLVRAYYAMHDTKTPVLVGGTAMMLSIGLSLVFSALFERWGWMPHGGLALAVSISTSLETGTLFLILRKKLPGMEAPLARGLLAGSAGTLGMALLLWWWTQVTGSAPAAWTALGGVGLGASVYFVLLLLLRVPEAQTLLAHFRRLTARFFQRAP